MSRQIKIGNLTLGGGAPIRVQSMTNTDTMDTKATVAQALRMVEAGCELVRITAPDVRAAENLGRIKDELLRHGCDVPLVADIHFNPKAAEVAATLVEKVRVNPGNYTDRNTGKLEFTEQEYNDELKRIGERMSSLIEICKAHHTAMRIGTNHGSLSERIMSRYGNTPEGMAQSAIEFAEV
ncbi:MAG: flavodoxin-dependent (E)-4-hydroxy-3-methylbut-2-enyl-diphosphate synthase, partial [Bacteroidales bacterium]|nr:flavodoxin-dependent (E)-4-hydroxy-3-methylbut-2-enyl-diphosphate synthase [Bacteroidales bacterium]